MLITRPYRARSPTPITQCVRRAVSMIRCRLLEGSPWHSLEPVSDPLAVVGMFVSDQQVGVGDNGSKLVAVDPGHRI